jgi:hypothetical protein
VRSKTGYFDAKVLDSSKILSNVWQMATSMARGGMELKLYAKIKVNGKWTQVSAGSVQRRVEAHERCECKVCHVLKHGLHEEE